MTVTTYYFAREDTACAFCGSEIKRQQIHLKKTKVDAGGVKRRVPWCGACVVPKGGGPMPYKAVIERVLSLPAGRELDAEIERARGHEVEWRDVTEGRHPFWRHPERPGGRNVWLWCSNYSTMIQHAWPLLAEMLSAGVWISMGVIRGTNEFDMTWHRSTKGTAAPSLADAPLAIARAWLVWRGMADGEYEDVITEPYQLFAAIAFQAGQWLQTDRDEFSRLLGLAHTILSMIDQDCSLIIGGKDVSGNLAGDFAQFVKRHHTKENRDGS